MKMQAFHRWLFAAKPSHQYRRRLEALTHFSCQQLMEVAGALTWDIWSADTATPAV